MADLPLLFFPQPVDADRSNLGGGGEPIRKPSASGQRTRLNDKFEEISSSFQAVSASEQGIEPEQVLVFETIGDRVEGLAKAAEQVPGLEWLAEMDLEDIVPEHGFVNGKDDVKKLPFRVYAVMSNQQAMAKLVSLWDNWCADPTERAKNNFGPFKNLFINLRDIRRWGVEDRIRTTELLTYLQERLQDNEQEIRFEVELWCRLDATNRTRAYEQLSSLVTSQGGICLQQSAIPEIAYHGVLVSMPAAAVQETVNGILKKDYGQLVRCEDVMLFRPFAQAGFDSTEPASDEKEEDRHLEEASLPEGNPIVAIFDGLPLEQHVAVKDRLIIDDADNHGERYLPSQQQHGTAMASLVLHGDLNENGAALLHPVYVRPILIPVTDLTNKVHEVTPDNELLVDLVHRAVRRLFEGESPAAPTVKLINLSVANRFQPFDLEMSPLGRLLDWLSWKYKVLFLVSVGNHSDDIALEATCSEWQNLDEGQLLAETLHTLRRDQRLRRPFAPSESVNAITVGAIHADGAASYIQGHRTDLLSGRRLPSPIGTFSSGLRRSIKPEIYLPGGRQLYNKPLGVSNDSAAMFSLSEGISAPGQLVASPSSVPLKLNHTIYSRGTSNATALATRLGAQIYERLEELRQEPGGDKLDDHYLAVVLKCLLVHGATWGENGDQIDDIFRNTVEAEIGSKDAWRELDRIKTRLLGYGEVIPERSLFSNDERVTVVGWSTIREDQGHQFLLPLPSALSASNVVRRVTGTLAWLSPVNPQHRNYRQAYLWFSLPEGDLGISRAEVDAASSRRGTVEHRVMEGSQVMTFSEDESLEITVSCKSDAGRLTEGIPYAFAATLEVAKPLDVSIFEQIRNRVRQRIDL